MTWFTRKGPANVATRAFGDPPRHCAPALIQYVYIVYMQFCTTSKIGTHTELVPAVAYGCRQDFLIANLRYENQLAGLVDNVI
jgi:hypothetical protein